MLLVYDYIFSKVVYQNCCMLVLYHLCIEPTYRVSRVKKFQQTHNTYSSNLIFHIFTFY